MNTTTYSNPLNMLPDAIRVTIYLVYAFASIVLTAILAGYAAVQIVAPLWVVFGLAFLGSLGAAFGFTAAANVKIATTSTAISGSDVVVGTVEDDAGEDPTVEDPSDTGTVTETDATTDAAA